MKETLNCKKFWHCMRIVQFALIAIPALSSAKVSRMPANYTPDDDMILIPVVIERNFIEEFNEKHKAKFSEANKKLEYWMAQEQYAQDYGMDNDMVNLPSEAQKQRFLERNYLRFISKDIEKSTNATLKETLDSWNADDELAAIENQDKREEYIIRARKQTGQTTSVGKDLNQTVKIGKKKLFRIDVQPRLELGMVKVTLKSKSIYARAWLGVNGNQEILLEKKIRKTKTKAKLNYFIEQERVLASLDQAIVKNVSMRLTHDKYISGLPGSDDDSRIEDNRIQVRFGMKF